VAGGVETGETGDDHAAVRPLLIANPSAGGRRAGRGLPAIVSAAEAALGPIDVELTARRGHGIELARRGAEEGRPLVVAVGGDGTLNEVVNGMMTARAAAADAAVADAAAARSLPRLGLISAGTGADFSRSLEGRRDRESQVAAIASGRERPIDVARAEVDGPDGERLTRYFVNILSAGPGGLVARYVQRMPTVVGGTVGYYLASLLALVRTPRAELICTITAAEAVNGTVGAADGSAVDGTAPTPSAIVRRTLSTYVLAVCNGQVFGGGYRVAPMAKIDDGRLEVVSAGTRDKLHLVRNMQKTYRGAHLGVAGVEHFGCLRIEVALADPALHDRFLMEIDGEELGRLPLTVDVLPGALTLRV
jgi:diacylglycerol kinase (ATP)